MDDGSAQEEGAGYNFESYLIENGFVGMNRDVVLKLAEVIVNEKKLRTVG
jgi:hypothetical protein